MAVSLQTEFRTAITQELQSMARSGKALDEMADFVQQELGLPKQNMVPVLAYFCHAFSLPLRVVLPLREWVEIHDDAEIEPLRTHLHQWVESSEHPK